MNATHHGLGKCRYILPFTKTISYGLFQEENDVIVQFLPFIIEFWYNLNMLEIKHRKNVLNRMIFNEKFSSVVFPWLYRTVLNEPFSCSLVFAYFTTAHPLKSFNKKKRVRINTLHVPNNIKWNFSCSFLVSFVWWNVVCVAYVRTNGIETKI